MGGQAPASVMQLSTFTTIQSIPRPEKYSDFPVTVRLVAPGKEQTVRAPIDVVAAIDRSMSANEQRLDLEKAAMVLLLNKLILGDRLAVVPFNDMVAKQTEELVAMSDDGKEKARNKVEALTADGGTRLSKPLERAEEILMGRGDVDRAAFIILLSDGGDPTILKDKEWERTSTSVLKDPKYPVHTFGFYGHDPDTLRYIAKRTKGTYTGIDITGTDSLRWFAGAFAGLLDKATTRLFNAVGTRTDLTSAHPGVSLSRIDSGAQKATIAGDGRSGAVDVGAVSAGETREFTVYLDVPEGDADADNMDLLAVGGVYTQGWDGRQVELNRSVVFVSRPAPPSPSPPPPPPPPPPCSCKELEWIEERLKYWCKVKLELSAMYDKAEAEAAGGSSAECNCKCQCTVTAVLREASAEATNRAMYQDVFTAVVHAIKLRECTTGGGETAVEHGDGGDKTTANSTTEKA